MRFRNNLGPTVLLISSSYIIFLFFNNDLSAYIHPRYELFTLIMAIACTVLIIIDQAFNNPKHRESLLGVLPIGLILIAALLLPAASLSTFTASQRSDSTGLDARSGNNQTSTSIFSGSSRALSINDWANILEVNKNESFYISKNASISGFILDGDLGDDTFLLSRFVLTCCAIDASPVGVPVRVENWSSNYEQDQWLQVSGFFRISETKQGTQLVLIPDEIKPIDEPEQPYVY